MIITESTSVKTYTPFGWIVHLIEFPARAVMDCPDNHVDGVPNAIHYYIRGGASILERETGKELSTRYSGHLSSKHINPPEGGVSIFFEDDTLMMCVDKQYNRGELPVLDVFTLEVGKPKYLKAGTKLFLCEGSLTIGDKTFDAPCPIHVGDKRVKASTTIGADGLIFDDYLHKRKQLK